MSERTSSRLIVQITKPIHLAPCLGGYGVSVDARTSDGADGATKPDS